MNNQISGETITLEYGTSHNPIRLIENNSKVNNIAYEGKRIVSYGENVYKYNDEIDYIKYYKN